MVEKQTKERDLSKNFISSRLFNFRFSKDNFLVPIFDFFNHNSKSSPFELKNKNLFVKQSITNGNDESFITYGNSKDVIDIALKYNFVEDSGG